MLIILILIGVLILANGFFAGAEMALVSAHQTRLRILAEQGDQSAAKVLAVQEKPSRRFNS
jgi:putative hemolysin